MERKTFTFMIDLSAGTDIETHIYVPFQPDEMIVRQISYKHDGTEAGACLIWTDLCGDYIGSFVDSCSTTPQSTFQIKREVNGVSHFQIRNVFGELDVTPKGNLMVTLEFVKNKK